MQRLAYDIAAALPFLRAEAEGRMTQTWRIGTLAEFTDEDTYEVVQDLDVVYEGPGRLKSVQATSVAEPVVGAQVLAVRALELHVPVDVAGIETDMRAVCVECPEDPTLVGVVVRVKGYPTGGQVTAARIPVEAANEAIEVGS